MPDGTHTIILFKHFKHKLLKKLIVTLFLAKGGQRLLSREACDTTGKNGQKLRVKQLRQKVTA